MTYNEPVTFFFFLIKSIFDFLFDIMIPVFGYTVSFMHLVMGFFVILFFITHFWRSKIQ